MENASGIGAALGSVIVTATGKVMIWADNVDDTLNRQALNCFVKTLEYNRFVMRPDQEMRKHYKIIAHDYWEGHNGDLKVWVHRSGRSIETEFVVGNRYPGSAWTRMSDYDKRRSIVHACQLVRAAGDLGYTFIDRRFGEPRVPIAVSLLNVRDCMLGEPLRNPLDAFNSVWSSTRYKRDASGWPEKSEYLKPCWVNNNNTGITAGSVVYCYHEGTLIRGIAYPNMNGMWWIESGVGRVWPSGKMYLESATVGLPRRDPSNHTTRLEEELGRAVKDKIWKRVAAIATVLGRE